MILHLRRSGRRVALLAMLIVAGGAFAAQGEDPLAEAQALLEQGQTEDAIKLLDRTLRKDKTNAEGFFLRSSASFVLGDSEAGKEDLERALELDPALRQGWLMLAALEIADERYEEALAAFTRAEELDPAAPENDLNTGATLLLLGRLDEATVRFERYLGAHPGEADASFLVATNYAMNGYAGLAVQNLQRAVALDERMRMQARSDPNFFVLADHPRFMAVMDSDDYEIPPRSHLARRTVSGPYLAGKGPLLTATLDALHLVGQSFEPQVEVAPEWALIWGDMRIKLADAETTGDGIIELSAPASAYSAAEWERRTKTLLDVLFVQLQKRR